MRPLFGRAAVVGAVVVPLPDADVDAVAGLAQHDGEAVALASLEGEGLGQIEVAAVDVDGDEVAFGHGLWHDERLVGPICQQRRHGLGFARGRDARRGEIHRSMSFEVIDAHRHLGGVQALLGEAVAGHERDGHLAQGVAGRDADGILGGRHVEGGPNHQVAGLVGGFCALVGTDAEGHGLHVGEGGGVGVVEVEVGVRLVVLPIDGGVGRPGAAVGESHVVHVVARGQQGLGRAVAVAVHHEEADSVSGLESVVRGTLDVVFHHRADADGDFFRRGRGRHLCLGQCVLAGTAGAESMGHRTKRILRIERKEYQTY